MGRTPRKRLLTPGMHIPAARAVAPPTFKVAAKPVAKPQPPIEQPNHIRRQRPVIQPLQQPVQSPVATIEAPRQAIPRITLATPTAEFTVPVTVVSKPQEYTQEEITYSPPAPFSPPLSQPAPLQPMQEQIRPMTAPKRRSKLPRIIVATVAIALVGGASSLTYAQFQETPSGIPAIVISKVQGFSPYYMGKSSKSGFTIKKDSASFDGSVLTFTMTRSDGKKLVVTEVKTLDSYDSAALNATQQFETTYGKAFITETSANTVGAIFTTDGTCIIANAPSPISTDDMRDFIASFGPVKPQQ